MNYRHAFHAGNFADVFKHVLLALLLDYLKRKDAPFRYIDTHAGTGATDLSSDEAQRTGEWIDGVGRLAGARWPADVARSLAPYLAAIGRLDEGRPLVYPGSPRVAQALMRPQDRASVCELHPEDARLLKRHVGRDERFRVYAEDGYAALNKLTPPPERRGLVLIDPPFEARDEFAAMEEAFVRAWRKWPTGVYALWYPVKDLRAVRVFTTRLKERAIPRMLRLELTVEAIRTEGPLAATGLIVVNPPYVLEAQARRLLPELARLLARGPGAGVHIEVLAGEEAS